MGDKLNEQLTNVSCKATAKAALSSTYSYKIYSFMWCFEMCFC